MNDFRRLFRYRIFTYQEVPDQRKFSDQFILRNPVESMEESRSFTIDYFGCKGLDVRMRVIKRDEGRPVLAGLGRLGLRIHFDCILRNIVMLHNIDCFTPIRIAENLVDVGRIKEIAVTENGRLDDFEIEILNLPLLTLLSFFLFLIFLLIFKFLLLIISFYPLFLIQIDLVL